jgi:hypothetical protein
LTPRDGAADEKPVGANSFAKAVFQAQMLFQVCPLRE